MPVNHDAFTAVAHVPLRHEVLIPSAELLGVRCAGRRRLAPDMRQANPKHRIDNLRNRFAEGLFVDETSAHIYQIGVAFGPSAATYALQSSVRAARTSRVRGASATSPDPETRVRLRS